MVYIMDQSFSRDASPLPSSISRRRPPVTSSIIPGTAAKGESVSMMLDTKQQAIKNLAHHAVCTVKMGDPCPANSHCHAMRTLCNHVTKCSNDDCPVPQCHRYKRALWHMEECQAGDQCLVCAPARYEKTAAVGVGMTAGLALTPPRSPRSTIWLQEEALATAATTFKVSESPRFTAPIHEGATAEADSKVSSNAAAARTMTHTVSSNQYPTAAETISAALAISSKQSPVMAGRRRRGTAATTTTATTTATTPLQQGISSHSPPPPPVAMVEVRSTPKPRHYDNNRHDQHDYPPARRRYKVRLVLGVRNNREYLP